MFDPVDQYKKTIQQEYNEYARNPTNKDIFLGG